MFIHAVYFWLRPELSDHDVERFKAGVHSLTTIDTVRQGYLGAPAATDRPVIDSSYSYALIVHFENAAGHDIYQEHAVHEKFRKECSPYWSKVQIYDCIVHASP